MAATAASGCNSEDPDHYQQQARFIHKPKQLNDLIGEGLERFVEQRQTSFQIERVVVLQDGQYQQFKETGLYHEYIFLFENADKMWFDPGELCWHCLLIKGEHSKDGVLVDAEGYSYARYAAFAPDCDRLRVKDVFIQYEYPARPPIERQATGKNKNVPER